MVGLVQKNSRPFFAFVFHRANFAGHRSCSFGYRTGLVERIWVRSLRESGNHQRQMNAGVSLIADYLINLRHSSIDFIAALRSSFVSTAATALNISRWAASLASECQAVRARP